MLKRLSLFCVIYLVNCLAVNAQQVNPKFTFFTQGDTPSAWQWILADPESWWSPIDGNEGVSKSGKLSISSADDATYPGAIKLKWNEKPLLGMANISGLTTDIARFEHRAELVLAVKLDKRGNNVTLKMVCGDKCEGAINLDPFMEKTALNTWFAIPIPLDCFAEKGVDLSNVIQPFSISTTSEMTLNIAEITLRAMPEGEEGCKPNPSN